MNDDFSIIFDEADLDRIEPLWNELRSHHAALSPRWSKSLMSARWPLRRAELLAKSAGGLLVLLAIAKGTAVGYCVCTINADRCGEVDSLYVSDSHRRRGIGERLMSQSLRWLKEKSAGPITVNVLADNEQAVRFYERFGFSPRTVTCVYTPMRDA